MYLDAKARAWADIFNRKTWLQERRREFRGSQKVSDAWLARLSPLINLQYLQGGIVSHIAELALFIVALPFVGIIRFMITINKTDSRYVH